MINLENLLSHTWVRMLFKKWCDEKKIHKELVMTKTDLVDFGNSSKCEICDNAYVDGDAKAKGHCHITWKYRGFMHSDC